MSTRKSSKRKVRIPDEDTDGSVLLTQMYLGAIIITVIVFSVFY